MKHLSVRIKLILGFAAVGVITLLVGLTGWLGLFHLKGILKEINGVRLPGIVGVAELQGDMWAIQRFERVLLYEKDPEIVKRQYTQLEENWKEAGQLLKNYELLPRTKEEGQLWDKIASKWEAWKVLHQTVIGLIKKGDQNSLKYAHELSYGKARTVFLESQEIFTHLLNLSLHIAAEDHERAETSEYRARITLAACALCGVLAVMFLGLFVTQSIQKSHEALRKSENWFSTTLKSIGDGVIATDPKGQITFMNSVAQTLTGWLIEEGLGRPMEDVFHIVNEETGDTVESPVTKVIREGVVVGLANHTVLIAKDGTRVPLNDSGAPIKDDRGNIIGAVLVFQDITELKEAMNALLRSEQETWVTVNNIPGIVFKGYVDGSVDPVDHFNDKVEPLTGYSKADFDYRHLKWTDLIVKEDLEGAKEIFLQALKSDNKAYVREYRIRNREGKEAWIQERSHIICDPSGKVENISGILFDITERKQAEKVIAEQTRILEAFFQYTPTPLAILDKDLNFIRVNQAYAQSGAHKLAHFLNHNHYELYPTEAQEIFEQVIRTKTPFQKSGQPFVYPNHPEWGVNYWDWILTPLLDSQGEVEFLILSLNEVTESKRAEEALRASEEEYRLLFENAQVGVFRGRIGDGKILKANHRLAEMFGYENHEEFLQEFASSELYADPGARERLITSFQEGKLESHEIRLYRKDGSILWVLVSGRLNPEKGYLEGVATDITHLKEVEEALQESTKRYQSMFEDSPISLWQEDFSEMMAYLNDLQNAGVKDLRAYFAAHPETVAHCADLVKIIDVNKATLEMYEAESKEELFQGLVHIFTEESYAVFQEEIIALAEGRNVFESETVNQTLKGKKMHILLKLSVIPGFGPTCRQCLLSILDITKRKQAEEEKRQLESQLIHVQKMEAIGTLAGGIAHDFNNILSALMGYTELTLDDIPEGTEAQANLLQVLRASERARDLVKQILTFSRQDKQERKPVQVSLIIKEALKFLRASLPTTIDIRQNLASISGKILADPTQIHQVLVNLCTNAAQAMQEKGGVLAVSLDEVDLGPGDPDLGPDLLPGPYLRLTVSDTGQGMTPEVMARIFEPFFTTKEPSEGTGMGLAVVHGIVKSHGGEIKVFSEPGKGTTFQVFFPRIESPAITETATLPEIPTGHERILLVDDEESLVRLGQQMLKRLGYEVVTKTSSLEALETFQAQPDRFDLVITDQTMPNMPGTKLAEELLRIRPDLPIILCTGFTETIKPEEAQTLGLRELVTKPLKKAELARIIRQVLEGNV